jgi:hypothetical protein
MTYDKPYAYLESMCVSENCQWCGEPYFAVSAISIGDILPEIPRQGTPETTLIRFIKPTQQKPPTRINNLTP